MIQASPAPSSSENWSALRALLFLELHSEQDFVRDVAHLVHSRREKEVADARARRSRGDDITWLAASSSVASSRNSRAGGQASGDGFLGRTSNTYSESEARKSGVTRTSRSAYEDQHAQEGAGNADNVPDSAKPSPYARFHAVLARLKNYRDDDDFLGLEDADERIRDSTTLAAERDKLNCRQTRESGRKELRDADKCRVSTFWQHYEGQDFRVATCSSLPLREVDILFFSTQDERQEFYGYNSSHGAGGGGGSGLLSRAVQMRSTALGARALRQWSKPRLSSSATGPRKSSSMISGSRTRQSQVPDAAGCGGGGDENASTSVREILGEEDGAEEAVEASGAGLPRHPQGQKNQSAPAPSSSTDIDSSKRKASLVVPRPSLMGGGSLDLSLSSSAAARRPPSCGLGDQSPQTPGTPMKMKALHPSKLQSERPERGITEVDNVNGSGTTSTLVRSPRCYGPPPRNPAAAAKSEGSGNRVARAMVGSPRKGGYSFSRSCLELQPPNAGARQQAAAPRLPKKYQPQEPTLLECYEAATTWIRGCRVFDKQLEKHQREAAQQGALNRRGSSGSTTTGAGAAARPDSTSFTGSASAIPVGGQEIKEDGATPARTTSITRTDQQEHAGVQNTLPTASASTFSSAAGASASRRLHQVSVCLGSNKKLSVEAFVPNGVRRDFEHRQDANFLAKCREKKIRMVKGVLPKVLLLPSRQTQRQTSTTTNRRRNADVEEQIDYVHMVDRAENAIEADPAQFPAGIQGDLNHDHDLEFESNTTSSLVVLDRIATLLDESPLLKKNPSTAGVVSGGSCFWCGNIGGRGTDVNSKPKARAGAGVLPEVDATTPIAPASRSLVVATATHEGADVDNQETEKHHAKCNQKHEELVVAPPRPVEHDAADRPQEHRIIKRKWDNRGGIDAMMVALVEQPPQRHRYKHGARQVIRATDLFLSDCKNFAVPVAPPAAPLQRPRTGSNPGVVLEVDGRREPQQGARSKNLMRDKARGGTTTPDGLSCSTSSSFGGQTASLLDAQRLRLVREVDADVRRLMNKEQLLLKELSALEAERDELRAKQQREEARERKRERRGAFLRDKLAMMWEEKIIEKEKEKQEEQERQMVLSAADALASKRRAEQKAKVAAWRKELETGSSRSKDSKSEAMGARQLRGNEVLWDVCVDDDTSSGTGAVAVTSASVHEKRSHLSAQMRQAFNYRTRK